MTSTTALVEKIVNPGYAPLSSANYNLVADSCSVLHKRTRIYGNVSVERHVILNHFVTLRGDIARVTIGSCVFFGDNTIVRPPMHLNPAATEAIPVTIGDNIFLGAGTVCEAAVLGNCVVVGERTVIGARAVIGSSVVVLPNSVIPPNANLGPYGIYGGNPVSRVGNLDPEVGEVEIKEIVSKKVGGSVYTP